MRRAKRAGIGRGNLQTAVLVWHPWKKSGGRKGDWEKELQVAVQLWEVSRHLTMQSSTQMAHRAIDQQRPGQVPLLWSVIGWELPGKRVVSNIVADPPVLQLERVSSLHSSQMKGDLLLQVSSKQSLHGCHILHCYSILKSHFFKKILFCSHHIKTKEQKIGLLYFLLNQRAVKENANLTT